MSESRSEFEAVMLPRWPNMNRPPRIISEGAACSGEYAHFNWQECWEVWQASRRAALEEAAKVCETAIDRREAKRTDDRIRAAIATKETDDELRALRHASSVGLHNGALERAARAIRALAAKTQGE